MSDQLLRCLGILSFIEEKNRIEEKPPRKIIENFVKSNFYQDEDSEYSRTTFFRDIDFIRSDFNDSLTSTKDRPDIYYCEICRATSSNFGKLISGIQKLHFCIAKCLRFQKRYFVALMAFRNFLDRRILLHKCASFFVFDSATK